MAMRHEVSDLKERDQGALQALSRRVEGLDDCYASLRQLHADLHGVTAESVEAGEARLRATIALEGRKLGMVMDDYTKALEARLLRRLDDRAGPLAAELQGSHERIMVLHEKLQIANEDVWEAVNEQFRDALVEQLRGHQV